MLRVLLILFCVMTASFSAVAEDDAKDSKDTKNKIVIVNGKKFYPLSNARSFNGSVKPMTAVKFPRVQHMPMAHNNAPRYSEIHLPDDAGKPHSDSEVPEASGTGSGKSGDKPSSEVLSVFEPEGK